MWTKLIECVPNISEGRRRGVVEQIAAAASGEGRQVIDLSLDAGPTYAGRSYVVLGSMTGTSPGTTLPGGLTLPLNWDYFTRFVRLVSNTVIFQSFASTLDGAGSATATIDTQGPIDPVLIGETAHFAYALISPYDFVSNAIPVTFDP